MSTYQKAPLRVWIDITPWRVDLVWALNWSFARLGTYAKPIVVRRAWLHFLLQHDWLYHLIIRNPLILFGYFITWALSCYLIVFFFAWLHRSYHQLCMLRLSHSMTLFLVKMSDLLGRQLQPLILNIFVWWLGGYGILQNHQWTCCIISLALISKWLCKFSLLSFLNLLF